jgi:hypothetical protein
MTANLVHLAPPRGVPRDGAAAAGVGGLVVSLASLVQKNR